MKKRNVCLLCIMAIGMALIMGACEYHIVYVLFGQYPNRLVYFKGVDEQLDMEGCTIRVITADGHETEHDANDMRFVYDKNVSFDTVGVYEAFVTYSGRWMPFPVQVIDEEYIQSFIG